MLVAQGIVRDAETNTLTIYSVAETIGSSHYPAIIPQLYVLVALQKDAGDVAPANGQISILLDEEELGNWPIAVDFQEKNRTRSIFSLQGLLVPRPGRLRFIFSLMDEQKGEWNIDVQPAGEPEVKQLQG